jgi:hypothetical protein
MRVFVTDATRRRRSRTTEPPLRTPQPQRQPNTNTQHEHSRKEQKERKERGTRKLERQGKTACTVWANGRDGGLLPVGRLPTPCAISGLCRVPRAAEQHLASLLFPSVRAPSFWAALTRRVPVAASATASAGRAAGAPVPLPPRNHGGLKDDSLRQCPAPLFSTRLPSPRHALVFVLRTAASCPC